jgi:hypothetical protein
MATFSQLPSELVEYVYSYLSQPDLYAMCRVNKGLHALAVPFLYRNADLSIGPGDKLRRIDWFCMNISKDKRLAARVETICLGPSPDEEVKEGQRWLPGDRHFDDSTMFGLAMESLASESLVSKGDYLRDALLLREYAAYAALIIIVLPSLRALYIADFNCASLDHLHTALRNLDPGPDWNHRHASDSLLRRLSSIRAVSFNVDRLTGIAYPRYATRYNIEPVLNLPSVQELEVSVPDRQELGARTGYGMQQGTTLWRSRFLLPRGDRLTNITKLVVRHSGAALQNLRTLLDATSQLQSFTYDFFYDCKERVEPPPRWLDLPSWSESLPRTLKSLVFSVEICDTGAFPFKQPRVGDKLFGYLDLTNFTNLHTVEVPFAFLTGDADFSITTDIYPLLPPNLRHLSLRTDMSNAQHQYPFDTSRLPRGLTFQESEDEARHLLNARMDVSYMFHATLALLEFANNLETISVWQPADASLNWFDGQIADFAQTCRNKSIKGVMVYPMILCWKNQEHWNLVKEVTAYDSNRPMASRHEVLHRGERAGIPLGLASQLHSYALRNHQHRSR